MKEKNRAHADKIRVQMREVDEKRRYGELMTEHERLVNDKDIKAYEDQNINDLYGKLPGFGGGARSSKTKRNSAKSSQWKPIIEK